MARTDNLNNFLTDVANSLRSKTETTEKISASNFDKIIDGIETGSEPILQEKIIKPTTSTKNITPDNGYDALSRVTILGVTNEIDDNIQEINIRKGVSILGVEGTLEEGTQPSGTLDITANGVYDVKDYASANVQVGESVVTKGIVVNAYNSNGYITDISIVGLTTIPSYYCGANSTSYLTALNKYLKYVSLVDTKTINSEAFRNCYNIISVIAPNCETIGSYAFYGCTALTNIEFPKITSIGEYAFQNCYKLAISELPNTITKIGEYAFHSCDALTLTSLPSQLTELGRYAFYSCDKIAITELPKTLNTLKDYTLAATGITSIKLHSGITTIPKNCFYQCSKLENVYFEASTISVLANAFGYCYALAKVVFENITNVPTTDMCASSNVFKNGEGVIYVPANMIDAFKNDTNYGKYADRIKDVAELE